MYQARTALLALVAAVASAAVTFDASAQTRLRFGHDQPVGSMYDEGHQALKRLVAEKTATRSRSRSSRPPSSARKSR